MDDTREALSASLFGALVEAEARVVARVPIALDVARASLADLVQDKTVVLAESALETAQGVDAMAVLTECDEYRRFDIAELKLAVKEPRIYGGRNHLPTEQIEAADFEYLGVDRR